MHNIWYYYFFFIDFKLLHFLDAQAFFNYLQSQYNASMFPLFQIILRKSIKILYHFHYYNILHKWPTWPSNLPQALLPKLKHYSSQFITHLSGLMLKPHCVTFHQIYKQNKIQKLFCFNDEKYQNMHLYCEQAFLSSDRPLIWTRWEVDITSTSSWRCFSNFDR